MLRLALIGVALVLAAVAGHMVKQYLDSQRAQLEEIAATKAPKPMVTAEVLVAANGVNMAGTVSSGDLRWEPWPEEGVHSRYILRKNRPDAIEKLAGSTVRETMFPGEPVTEEKLILKQDGSFLAAIMPEDGRAITVKVDEASGLAGMLRPGDHVDILLTHEVPNKDAPSQSMSSGNGKNFVTETILRDLRILAVDQEFKRDDKSGTKAPGKTSTTVTLSVDIAQAEALAVSRSLGTLTLTLRSAFGTTNTDRRQQPYTASSDISSALRTGSRPAAPKPASEGAVSIPGYTVTVFHGLTPETVTLGR
ncbi:MAG: Flp pilus assembly protein CpaB [Rhodospirillaceae bacterium]